MYWRTADVSANGPSMRSPGRYIGGAGMNAPPTQWPVLVGKVHHRQCARYTGTYGFPRNERMHHLV